MKKRDGILLGVALVAAMGPAIACSAGSPDTSPNSTPPPSPICSDHIPPICVPTPIHADSGTSTRVVIPGIRR